MHRRTTRSNQSRLSRRGFTLVEMLVAVALVAILMTMFAQIFTLASGVLSQQRGLANNDQTERNLRTIIRDDLSHRTFLKIIPFTAGVAPVDPQAGYFHIAEGASLDHTDDLIQFTASTDLNEEPYYGRAIEIPGYPIASNPDQPEFDDDVSSLNSVGSSRFAEIAYFLRGGNLYRRVLLIRDKAGESGDYVPKTPPPAGSPMIPGTYGPNFWSDFDYSAFFNGTTPEFLSTENLQNTYTAMPPVAPSFGISQYRFGFDPSSGIPKSYLNYGGSPKYIGRFTHEETSYSGFVYPGNNTANPFTNNELFLSQDFRVTDDGGDNTPNTSDDVGFSGSRVAEDILLRNVHAFDIKVWDPGFLVGPDGEPGVAGVDDDSKNGTDDIGELGTDGSDDWYGPDGQPGIAGVDDDGLNGVDDPAEVGTSGSDDADSMRFFDLGHGLNTGLPNTPFYAFNSVSPVGHPIGNCYDTWHPNADVNGEVTVPYDPQTGGEKIPITLIRIHIRYVDQKSDQMRDMIIVHSLKTE